MLARRSLGPQQAATISRYFVPVVVTGGNRFSVQAASGIELSSDLNEGFAKFRSLPESQRKPDRVPLPPKEDYRLPIPPGGIAVRVFTRGFDRTPNGSLQPIAKHSLEYSGPQRDFLWLTADEVNSTFPRETRQGETISLSNTVAQRIARYHLLDNTICLPASWPSEHIRKIEMLMTVVESTAEQLTLSLKGDALLFDHQQQEYTRRSASFEIQGRLRFDRLQRRVEQFDIAAIGDYRNDNVTEYYQKAGQRTRLTLGVAFELATPDSLGYGTVPFALWDGIHSSRPGSSQVLEYFGSDPYHKQPR
jgi:hypothetical protein